MKRIGFCFLLLFWGVSIAYAGQSTIYEKTFQRKTSTPDEQTADFLAAGKSAKITVINGGMEDDAVSQVSSAEITINGKVLFGPSDFNQNVDQIERVVDLNENYNTLNVMLRGKPGGQITIKVEQENSTAGVIKSNTGGSVEVDDPDSSISGAKVEIPADVVDQDVEMVMAATEIPEPLPTNLYQAGANVSITSNVETFNSDDVSLSIPYNDKNNDGVVDGTTISELKVGVKYFNETTGEWEDVEVFSRDTDKNLVTVKTNHFSDYVAYFNGQVPKYDVTQTVQNGAITIDGNADDWAGLEPINVDPQGDTRYTTDPNFDIKAVYTAIDDTYAYLMIETYGEDTIPSDVAVQFWVNYKPGEAFLWQPYADMMITLFGNGYIYFRDSSGKFYLQGCEVAIGSVMEFMIPRSKIEDATYFNVTNALIRPSSKNTVYDTFAFGPYINFWIDSRQYGDGSPFTHVSCEFNDEYGNGVVGDINLQSMTLKNLDDGTEQVIEAGPSNWLSWFLLSGQWLENYWFHDDYFGGGGGYYVDVDSLEEGNYRLTVFDQLGNKYERDCHFELADTPHVYPSIADDNLFFDNDGNLHAYWNSFLSNTPEDHVRFYPFVDTGEPVFTAIWNFPAFDRGAVFVPKEKLELLYAKGDQFSLGFQTRAGGMSNRWYAPTISMDDIPHGTPAKWQQPIVEDWATNGFEPIRWYKEYYGKGAKISANSDSVSLETATSPGLAGRAKCTSQYLLEGDFDIQVDFNINEWPVDGEALKFDTQLALQIGYDRSESYPRIVIGITPSGNSTGLQRSYFSGSASSDPASWARTNFEELAESETNDTFGKFRIKRSGLFLNTYYWDNQNGTWVELNTCQYNADYAPNSVPILMIADNYGGADGTEGGSEGNPGLRVKGTFSNFKRNL